MKRTTLLIPERVWRSAKVHAFREGRTLQEEVTFALESYLGSIGQLEPEPAGTANRTSAKGKKVKGGARA